MASSSSSIATGAPTYLLTYLLNLGGVILLFNCYGCPYVVAEGSADPSLLPETNEVEIVAAFNLQRVGLLRESRKVSK